MRLSRRSRLSPFLPPCPSLARFRSLSASPSGSASLFVFLSLLFAFAAIVFRSPATATATALPTDRQPTCADSTGHAFPLTTRVHGGPDTYEPGGAAHTWFIDLKNTTPQPCGNIHPVVVLVDSKHALTVAQPKMEFSDGKRSHPVKFERTDQDELVGAFDDGFPGFTVAPGRTLTVQVRLGLTSDTPQDDVVVNAAVVQRHGDDGDWVGQSNDYKFRIEGAGGPAGVGTQTAPGSRSPDPQRSPARDELANTGPRAPHGLGAMLSGLLLMAGGVLVTAIPYLLKRRRR